MIDFAANDLGGQPLWVRQLKTRREPYAWAKADVVAIVGSWLATPLAGAVPFEFVTDGQLTSGGKSLAKLFEEESYAELARLFNVPVDRLVDVTITTRVPNSSALLDQAELRLLRAGPLVTAAQAVDRVNRMLRMIVLASGSERLVDRTLTVDELSVTLGILPASWRLSREGGEAGNEPDVIGRPDLLSAIIENLAFDELERGRVALWGISGSGKTTLANQVHDAISGSRRTAVLVPLENSDNPSTALARIKSQVTGTAPLDHALSALASDVVSATAVVDLLICDNVVSEDVGNAIAASVAPRTAVLVTSRSSLISGPFVPVEVVPLATDEVVAALQAEAPDADVAELAAHIYGWPLLLDLVRTSLRRHIAMGGNEAATVADHARRLRRAGPPDFDTVSKATRVALELSLEGVPATARDAAFALGIVRTSLPLPIHVFRALWDVDLPTAQSWAVALASAGIMRLGGPNEASIHDAVSATLRTMLDDEGRILLNTRLAAASDEFRDKESAWYFTEHLPVHVACGSSPNLAMLMLVDPEWVKRAVDELGSPLHLSRQARAVLDTFQDHADTPLWVVICVWLIQRLYAVHFVLDRRVAAIFAAVHGLTVTEALLKAGGSSHEAAGAHAELASALARAGRLADAQRNARAALLSAREESALDLPDTLLVTVQSLGRTAREWVRSAVETIEFVIALQKDPPSAYMTRAIAAATLLPLDPSVALQIAQPLIDRVRNNLPTATPLEGVLGDATVTTIRHLLPTLAYADPELAFGLLDKALEEDEVDSDHPYVELIPGLLLAGEEVSDDLLLELEQCETVSVHDLAESLALSKRYGEAIRVADAIRSRQTRAVLHATIGRVMHDDHQSPQDVDHEFNSAIALLNQLPPATMVPALPRIASEMVGYDADWARKLAGQAINYLSAVIRADERVSVEASARALLAELDPSHVDPEVTGLLARSSSTRPARDPTTPVEAIGEIELNFFAAVLDSSNPLPHEKLLAARVASWADPSLYWNRWALRLQRTPDVADAATAVNDPDFGSWVSQVWGAASLAAWLLLSAGQEFELDPGLADDPTALGRLSVDVILLRVLLKKIDAKQAASEIDSIDRASTRAHGVAGLDAMQMLEAGDVESALRGLLERYVAERSGMTQEFGFMNPYVVGLQRMPLAVRLALDGQPTLDDVARVLEGEGGRPGTEAFIADVLQTVRGLTVGDVDAILEGLELNYAFRRTAVLTGVRAVLPSSPEGVAEWLSDQPTSQGPWQDGLDIDDWAGLAYDVLVLLAPDSAERARLVEDARRRLRGLDFGVETEAGVALAAAVAPDALEDARAFLSTAVSPFLEGPALCEWAIRKATPEEWCRAFLDGLALTRSGQEDTVAGVALMAGRALGRAGQERARKLISCGGLDTWPGQFIGAAGGVAGMIAGLERGMSADEVFQFLAIVRLAAERAREMGEGATSSN